MNRKELLKLLASFIFFIFLLNTLALVFHWYSSIWYFDMVTHFLGGAWLGLVAIYLFSLFASESKSFKLSLEPKALTKAIFRILAFVFFIGIGWEMFEVVVDELLTYDSFNLLDSVSDVFFDLAGGLSAVYYSIIKK